MFGAIIGDMVGSVYEFSGEQVEKNSFSLFNKNSKFTDDTVMSIAVSDAIMRIGMDSDDDSLKKEFFHSMKKYGYKYLNAGYGKTFFAWILSMSSQPYGSFGNGSAMRVSSIPYYCSKSLENTRRIARLSAEVTHNHPEGIKGAESVASAIWLALHGSTKENIRSYIEKEFGYDLSKTCEDIISLKICNAICQDTVPNALVAFLESESFEDAIRNAISFGGDTDTLAAISGSVAEAYYGVPLELEEKCLEYLDSTLRLQLLLFERKTERAIWTDIKLRNQIKLSDNEKL